MLKFSGKTLSEKKLTRKMSKWKRLSEPIKPNSKKWRIKEILKICSKIRRSTN